MTGVQPAGGGPTRPSLLHRWEHRGTPATLGTPRGLAWSAVLAIGVFQLSQPAKLIPSFLPSLTVLAIMTVVLLLAAPPSIRLPRVPWTVVAFLGVCAISVLWSIDRSNTIAMTTLYATMSLLAACWVAQTDAGVLLRGIAWGGLLITISIATFLLLDPAVYGTALTQEGIVLGPYPNRNYVASALTTTLPAALMRSSKKAATRVEIVLTIVAHLVGLMISQSATGRVAAVGILLAYVIIKILSRLRGRNLAIGWAVVTAVLVAASATLTVLWGRILELLGKTPDLSGRLRLWMAIEAVWRERPVTGYGFGTVWRYIWLPLDRSPIRDEIEKLAGFRPVHGHNALFDLLPQLGVVGAVALLLLMGVLAFRAITQLAHAPDTAGWALLTFVALVIAGSTEIGLLRPLGWFLVVAATAACRSPGSAFNNGRGSVELTEDQTRTHAGRQ